MRYLEKLLWLIVFGFFPVSSALSQPIQPPSGLSAALDDNSGHTCEAISGGRCFYIDAVYGNDSSNGALNTPWKTLKKVFSFYEPRFRPAGWIALQAGDVVYLKNGVYSDATHPGTDAGANTSPAGGPFVIYMRRINGTAQAPVTIKAFPGHKPVIDPGRRGTAIQIHQSSNVKLQGLEVRNAWQNGIWVTDSDRIALLTLEVHSVDGVDNDNIAGVHFVDSTNVELASSTLHDNYDRTNADTGGVANENSSNMVVFRGGNINVHDNTFYQTPPVTADKTGACLKYKHASADPSAVFTVERNVFKNCRFYALGVGTANTYFRRNVVIGGYGVQSRDLGGLTHQVNQVFENNTFYNVQMPFEVIPTIDWRNSSFPNDPQNIRFEKNIVLDAATNYWQEVATVNVGTYMTDALYDVIKPQLTLRNNCYSATNSPKFNIGAANGGNYGSKGGAYSLSNWQQLGFDQGSVIARAEFLNANAGDFRLQTNSACQGLGAY